MDSKPKAGYLSLKRTLESTKYKLKYCRTQEKNFNTNTSFPVSSLQPTRKPSEVLLKNSNHLNNSIEKSTVYHYQEEPSQFSESYDTCFYSFSKNKSPKLQVSKENKNFCSKCGKENEANREIYQLRAEVRSLRDALNDIQNLLGIDQGFAGVKKKVEIDLEDKRNTAGFCRLQEKLNKIQRMYEC